MSRHVFYLNTLESDPSVVAAAEKTAKGLGATVVRKAGGSILLEAAPSVIAKIAEALPGWRHNPEQTGYRVPERSPLQRARLPAKG